MNIKKLWHQAFKQKSTPRRDGFSLLELVVAFTIFAAVFLTIFALVSNVQITQKKVQVANSFYNESRLVIDRVVQIIRNHTIDYDRYYCDQDDLSDCDSLYSDSFLVTLGGRTRNLGGVDQDGNPDSDTDVFSCSGGVSCVQDELYLIAPDRQSRVALQVNNNGQLQLQKQIGQDDDGDGVVDSWSVSAEGGHDWTVIAPDSIKISRSKFILGPNKDPYLAFADDAVQKHPFVRLLIEMEMTDGTPYGFSAENPPSITFQTSASSRVYGNTRQR